MNQSKGYLFYKKFWENQAGFMDESPWSNEKILKITILKEFAINLKDLKFSNHSLTIDGDKLILRLKIPYNYYELDSFKSKAIELLGIEKNWLVDLKYSSLNCTHSLGSIK